MKLQFQNNLTHQHTAVASVLRLFGNNVLPKFDPSVQGDFGTVVGEIVSNYALDKSPDESRWLTNLQQIQDENNIPQNDELDFDGVLPMLNDGRLPPDYPSFNVEMETGTGKTYVYLRTIYQLYQEYNLSKFIIVVPSVAIYEGVKKTFEMTRGHFEADFPATIVHLKPYDGSNPAMVKTFAESKFCEILLITLQSFDRASNTLYKETDKLPGSALLPYQYLQATRPVLLLDEPQNMESPKAKSAMKTLSPLFALRYSATHRTAHNVVYRLSPFEAFRQGLVKRIEVVGITETNNRNEKSYDWSMSLKFFFHQPASG